MIGVLIVVFRPDVAELGAALDALVRARDEGLDLHLRLWHNDAGPQATPGLADAYERVRAGGLPMTIGGGRGNLGFGRGVNALLESAAEDAVLLLNQDAIPEPGALARLWHTARADAPDVAAWEMRQIPYEHPKDYDPVTLDTGWCSGAAVLLRTAALRAVGGFEPRIFMYGEDVDLSWRLRCAGWRLRYLPRCAVVHRTYATPNEVKPLLVLGSVYANLALRARFAGRRCVAQGLGMILRTLRGPQPFAGRRWGIVKALVRFARDYPYYRRTRRAAPGFEPVFSGWDFERRREGAFHAFRAAAEQPARRPRVTLVVLAGGDPGRLREALATVANQTHRPLEIVVAEVGGDACRAVGAAFEDQLDVRHVALGAATPPAAAFTTALPAATGDWIGWLRDDDRLYGDHVEVLLQAAIDAGASGAVALARRIPGDAAAPAGTIRPEWPSGPGALGAATAAATLPPRAALWRRGVADRIAASLAEAAPGSPPASLRAEAFDAPAIVRKLTSTCVDATVIGDRH